MKVFFILTLIFRLILKFLQVTGLYIPILAIIMWSLIEKFFNITTNVNTLWWYLEEIILFLSFIPVPFISIGNIIRLIKSDFSFINYISNFKGK